MKLTPAQLSKEPIRITVEPGRYDFATQQRVGVPTAMARTVNGTRTYRGDGTPYDSDND